MSRSALLVLMTFVAAAFVLAGCARQPKALTAQEAALLNRMGERSHETIMAAMEAKRDRAQGARWEYKVEGLPPSNGDQRQERLNELGGEGWEVFAVTDYTLYAKRRAD